MASDEEDDIELNDLDALARELDALKKALGSNYQQVRDEGLQRVAWTRAWGGGMAWERSLSTRLLDRGAGGS